MSVFDKPRFINPFDKLDAIFGLGKSRKEINESKIAKTQGKAVKISKRVGKNPGILEKTAGDIPEVALQQEIAKETKEISGFLFGVATDITGDDKEEVMNDPFGLKARQQQRQHQIFHEHNDPIHVAEQHSEVHPIPHRGTQFTFVPLLPTDRKSEYMAVS